MQAAGMGLALTMAALALPACDGNLGGGFLPAAQPADICSVLSLSDVQTILPTAAAGTGEGPAESFDIWSEECDWSDSNTAYLLSVSLEVEGALTAQANMMLDTSFQRVDPAETTPVSGVGDQAEYISGGIGQTIWARKGSYLVSVIAYYFTPDVTAAQLQPLVLKAIGNL